MGSFGFFVTSFLVGLTGAMMPGPMLSVTLERSARFGWIAGPLVVAGHGILEMVLITGIFFGIGQIITAPLFTSVVGIAGGAVLIWFGVRIIKGAASVRLPHNRPHNTDSQQHRNEVQGNSKSHWLKVMGSGATTSLSNPYWLLWWGTVGASYVTLAVQQGGATGVISFFTGHILSDFAWFTAMAAVMAGGRRLLPQDAYTGLLRLLGLFLVFMAGYFVYSGADTLLQLL